MSSKVWEVQFNGITSSHAPQRPEIAEPAQHVIFGGTGRTGEESVGSSAPDPSTLVDKNERRAVYQTPERTTTVLPSPGVTGGWSRQWLERLTGIGETGMEANTQMAMEETLHRSNSDSPPLESIGYSRGAVSAMQLAVQRAKLNLPTVFDARDPVAGGRSSITDVDDNVQGRQQVSLGNYLPRFGATLFSGQDVSTVVTTDELGGHSARARSNFSDPLPQGEPGKVTIFDGVKAHRATKADSARLKRKK